MNIERGVQTQMSSTVLNARRMKLASLTLTLLNGDRFFCLAFDRGQKMFGVSGWQSTFAAGKATASLNGTGFEWDFFDGDDCENGNDSGVSLSLPAGARTRFLSANRSLSPEVLKRASSSQLRKLPKQKWSVNYEVAQNLHEPRIIFSEPPHSGEHSIASMCYSKSTRVLP